MHAETKLIVRVDRLLLDVAAETRFAHEREHTYRCTPITGEAAPGHEPEPEFAAAYSFIEVRWLPLADEAAWGSGQAWWAGRHRSVGSRGGNAGGGVPPSAGRVPL